MARTAKARRIMLSAGRLDVEHGIRPPFALAVTLPVRVNDKPSDVSVYVTTSPFNVTNPTSASELQIIAAAIALLVNAPDVLRKA